MNNQIKKFVEQSGGDFWQRIESDGVLNKEAYITFDPPEKLAKFAELIVRECMRVVEDYYMDPCSYADEAIKEHFGVEE